MSKFIKAYVGVDMLGVVDRLFGGDVVSIVSELAQNARRAGAKTLTITRSKLANGASRMDVIDDGVGIPDPQILLGLRDSAWQSPEVASEDPAGMGFFALATCRRAGVASLGWSIQDLSPEVFTGKATAEVCVASPIVGTHVWFEYDGFSYSPWDDAKLIRFLGLCGMSVTVDEKPILPVKFGRRSEPSNSAFSLCAEGEFVDLGVEYVIHHEVKDYITDAVTRFNFFGFEGTVDLRSALGLGHGAPAGAGCSVYLNLQNARRIKPVLPARKELVHNDALRDLCARIDWAAYTLVNSRPHFLPFLTYQHALHTGVPMLPASCCLVPVSVDPARACAREFVVVHGKGVRPETHAVVPLSYADTDHSREDFLMAQLFDGRLRWHENSMPLDLAWDRHVYKGYAWYDAMPVCHLFQGIGKEVFVIDADAPTSKILEDNGYEVTPWDAVQSLRALGTTVGIAIVVDPAGHHIVSELEIPAVVHPDVGRPDNFDSVSDQLCVSSSSSVEDVVEWVTNAVKPEEFPEDEDGSMNDEWDNECLAAVRLRLQTRHQARADVFRRFVYAAQDALSANSVRGLSIQDCAFHLRRGHGHGANWRCAWRVAGDVDLKKTAGARRMVVERTVVHRAVIDIPVSSSLDDAISKAVRRASEHDVEWVASGDNTEAFEEGTEWTIV